MGASRRFDPTDAINRARGLAPRSLLPMMEPGAVFVIKDDLVVLPEERLPTAGPRKAHFSRRVILVQATPLLRASAVKTLVIVPCSASSTAGPLDVSIPNGESGFDADGVVAFTSLVQPILKSDLETYKGVVCPDTLGQINDKLRVLLNLQAPHTFTPPRGGT